MRNFRLFGIRGSVVVLAFLAAMAVSNLAGVKAFGQFSSFWSMMIFGATLISLGTPKLLLKVIPVRKVDNVFDIPLRSAILHLVALPLLINGIYIGALLAAYHFWGWFEPIKTLPNGFFALFIATFAVHFVNLLATLVRVTIGPGSTMFLRDGLHHFCIVILTLILTAVGTLTVPILISVFCGAIFTICGLTFIYVIRTTNLSFSRTAPTLNFQSSAYWGNSIMGGLITNIDVIAASAFFAPEQIGLYVVIKRVANFVSFPQVISNDKSSVGIAQSYAQNDITNIQAICRSALRLTLPFAICVSGLVFFTQTLWLKAFNFEISPEATLTCAFLVLANLISVLFGVNFMVAAQSGREKSALLSRLSGAIIFAISAAVLFSSTTQTWAIAVAFLCGVSIMNISIWFVLLKTLRIDSSVTSFFRSQKT